MLERSANPRDAISLFFYMPGSAISTTDELDPMEQAEQGRLDELSSFHILDTPPEPKYDDLVRLAAKHCDTPIALITLLDEGRQWFKAVVGLDLRETERAISFCTHTIAAGEICIVPDARLDPRFHDNPLVTGPPHLIFYAGIPLRTERNHILGTLAVLNTRPHYLTENQLELLELLAKQVMVQLELRRHAALLATMTRERDALQSTQLELSKQRYQHIAKATTDTIWDWNLVTDEIAWNDGLKTCFGHHPDQVERDSSSWTNRIHPDDAEEVLAGIHAVIDSRDEAWQATYRFRRSDGSYAHVVDRGFVIRDQDGRPLQMIGGMSDISAQHAMEAAHEQIRKLAYFDALTELPNRALLIERLHEAFAHARRDAGAGCILFIDLDNFKSLNDTLGHDKGDILLRQVAGRLRNCVRTSDTVARLGGDEFVVLVEGLPHDLSQQRTAAEQLAEKILGSFTHEYALGEHNFCTTPSIGVAFFDHQNQSVDELLRFADLAMYQSKAAGRNTVRFFEPHMSTLR